MDELFDSTRSNEMAMDYLMVGGADEHLFSSLQKVRLKLLDVLQRGDIVEILTQCGGIIVRQQVLTRSNLNLLVHHDCLPKVNQQWACHTAPDFLNQTQLEWN